MNLGGARAQHHAAIDLDRLRDRSTWGQIDTRVHPKLHNCVFVLVVGPKPAIGWGLTSQPFAPVSARGATVAVTLGGS